MQLAYHILNTILQFAKVMMSIPDNIGLDYANDNDSKYKLASAQVKCKDFLC